MISEDVIAFLRSRPIAMLCTRDHNNCPSAHETFLAEVTSDEVLVLVPQHLARNLESNVADNGAASLLISRAPGDHRSVQLKGTLSHLEAAHARPELFAGAGPLLEMWRSFLPEPKASQLQKRMQQQPVYSVRLHVKQVFDQTPGQGAGRQLAGQAT
jgi:hypothetical protein